MGRLKSICIMLNKYRYSVGQVITPFVYGMNLSISSLQWTFDYNAAYVRAWITSHSLWVYSPGLIVGLRPASERRRYFVATSLIGWAQAYNQPCSHTIHSNLCY